MCVRDEVVLVCCPVCGARLSGTSLSPLSSLSRSWSCSACGSWGCVSWPVSCSGVFVVDESPLVGFMGWLGVERPVADCLVPFVRPCDCVDETVLAGSGRWSVFASSGVPVGCLVRDGLRVDAWHVLRPGRVSSLWLDGEADDVDVLRGWLLDGAGGVLPRGAYVGR